MEYTNGAFTKRRRPAPDKAGGGPQREEREGSRQGVQGLKASLKHWKWRRKVKEGREFGEQSKRKLPKGPRERENKRRNP